MGLDESPEELRFMAWQDLSSGDVMQLEAYVCSFFGPLFLCLIIFFKKSYEADMISAVQHARMRMTTLWRHSTPYIKHLGVGVSCTTFTSGSALDQSLFSRHLDSPLRLSRQSIGVA